MSLCDAEFAFDIDVCFEIIHGIEVLHSLENGAVADGMSVPVAVVTLLGKQGGAHDFAGSCRGLTGEVVGVDLARFA